MMFVVIEAQRNARLPTTTPVGTVRVGRWVSHTHPTAYVVATPVPSERGNEVRRAILEHVACATVRAR